MLADGRGDELLEMSTSSGDPFVVDVGGDGTRYLQDHYGLVRKGAWVVPRCYFGRPGGIDCGKHFGIVAVATARDGRVVQSECVTVRRR